MPKATPRDIANPQKFDHLVNPKKEEPETEAHRDERTRYWASLRKKVAAGAKIPDGKLIGFTFGRGMTK